MSTRTSASVRDQSPYPEVGATPATWEACDVSLGNKVRIEERVLLRSLGQPYRDYQQRVAFFLPRPPKGT